MVTVDSVVQAGLLVITWVLVMVVVSAGHFERAMAEACRPACSSTRPVQLARSWWPSTRWLPWAIWAAPRTQTVNSMEEGWIMVAEM